MRKVIPILAALLLSCPGGTAAAPRTTATQKLVTAYAAREPLRSGSVSILAVRMNGDTLAQYNRRQKLVPASNVKLITTGLALTHLGPSWRFRTSLAYSGEVRDSVLLGDVYILGGGDPTTGSASECSGVPETVFGAWKALLEEAGIARIEGRIIGDPRGFSRLLEHPSWQLEDLGYNYGAAIGGLNFFENAQLFNVKPGAEGKAPVITPTYPDAPWMSWTVHATTGAASSSNTIYCVNSKFGPWGEFHGSFPSDRKSYTFEGSNRFGAWTCAYYFYKFLSGNGISSDGWADVTPTGIVRTDLLYSDIGPAAVPQDSLKALGSTLSPSLSDIIHDTNCQSDNFFAEALFSALGRSIKGSPDREASAEAEGELFKAMGLKTLNACTLEDGSGLSRKNYVSSEFFVSFLRKMISGKGRGPYLGSLPSPGGKNTLKNRLPGAPEELKARVKMKSGSMNGVRCFSGYILPAEGGEKDRTVVFSILTNNINGQGATVYSIIDEIIVSLAGEP